MTLLYSAIEKWNSLSAGWQTGIVTGTLLIAVLAVIVKNKLKD